MSNEIEKIGKQELTYHGQRVRTSKEQMLQALAPMFVAFPNLEMSEATFNAYHMMLADLDANKLAVAVMDACRAHKYPTQLVTVAAIREAYDGTRQAPGPRSDVDPRDLPDIPMKMFRLEPEEDRRQRMNQLRRTRNWKYDA